MASEDFKVETMKFIVNLTDTVVVLTDNKGREQRHHPSNIRDCFHTLSEQSCSFGRIDFSDISVTTYIKTYSKSDYQRDLPVKNENTIYIVPEWVCLVFPDRDDFWILGKTELRTGDVRSIAKLKVL